MVSSTAPGIFACVPRDFARLGADIGIGCVDLVLDIGNSRSCGILIESFAGDDHVDLGNSMVLQLRDLTNPDKLYSEPFESQVELAQADFGPERLSRRSGRLKAFLWPSLVRIGPEAARFREVAEGTEKIHGIGREPRVDAHRTAASIDQRTAGIAMPSPCRAWRRVAVVAGPRSGCDLHADQHRSVVFAARYQFKRDALFFKPPEDGFFSKAAQRLAVA